MIFLLAGHVAAGLGSGGLAVARSQHAVHKHSLGAAVCRGALRTRRTPRQPYAYSTLMVFVLPLRPLMMPPVMMTLSPFSSCITCRLTCSAW